MTAINSAITKWKWLKERDLEDIEYRSLPTPSTISSGHSGSLATEKVFLGTDLL